MRRVPCQFPGQSKISLSLGRYQQGTGSGWWWRQQQRRREGRRIAQAALPFASRCFKMTAFGANESEASASNAERMVELEEVEYDLGQTAFGVK